MFIRTKRLFLRPAWPEDCLELQAAIADERIVHNLARVPWPCTVEDAGALMSRPQDLHPGFLVTAPGARGSRVIGGAGLHPLPEGAEFGFWVVPDSWGYGYATEAASAVLRLARTLGHRQIKATPFVDNPAAVRVLEKVGFRWTGTIADRDSRSRGGAFPSREYVIAFDSASDCDGAAMEEAQPDMRAA